METAGKYREVTPEKEKQRDKIKKEGMARRSAPMTNITERKS